VKAISTVYTPMEEVEAVGVGKVEATSRNDQPQPVKSA
jgi:hypothetical protein